MFSLARFAHFALCALSLITLVSAFSLPNTRRARAETNAQRLARGLTPARPKRLYAGSKTSECLSSCTVPYKSLNLVRFRCSPRRTIWYPRRVYVSGDLLIDDKEVQKRAHGSVTSPATL